MRSHLSTFFSWCVDDDLLPSNPISGLRIDEVKYVGRERVLELDELAKLWIAAESFRNPHEPFMKLLILTGQRRGEVAKFQREWLEADDNVGRFINIPAEAYKTGKQHLVPITTDMAQILDDLPLYNAGTFLITTTAGKKPFSGFSKSKVRFDKTTELKGWTFHDIRRSVATHMASLGVLQEHIEQVLGHAIPGVAKTYNRYAYLPEKRIALETWAEAFSAALKSEASEEFRQSLKKASGKKY